MKDCASPAQCDTCRAEQAWLIVFGRRCSSTNPPSPSFSRRRLRFWSSSEPMPDYLDVRKFELDKKRFRFEKEKYAAENRVIIKHFSVTITAMISAAAVLISGFQALISYNS